MIKQPKGNGLKTGHTTYINNNNLDSKKSDKHKLYRNIREGKYPNGIFPFVLLLIIFLVIFLIAFFVPNKIIDPQNNQLIKLVYREWYDCLWIASGVSLLLNLVWLILRQNFNVNSRYNMKKYAHKFRFDSLRFTQPRTDEDYSLNRVENVDEYREYLQERTLRTKMMFYISLGIHSGLFLIATIINVVYMTK